MKLIVLLTAVMFVPLTTGMGQAPKHEQRPNKQPNGVKQICTDFVIDSIETKWTDLGRSASNWRRSSGRSAKLAAPRSPSF